MTTFLGGSGLRSYWEYCYASARRGLIVNVIQVRGLERNVLNLTGMPPEEPVMPPVPPVLILVLVGVLVLFFVSFLVVVYAGRLE